MKDRTGKKICGSCRCYKNEELYTSKFGLILKTFEPCRVNKQNNYIKKDRSDEVRCARCTCFRNPDDFKDDQRNYKSCCKCRLLSRTHMAKKKKKV